MPRLHFEVFYDPQHNVVRFFRGNDECLLIGLARVIANPNPPKNLSQILLAFNQFFEEAFILRNGIVMLVDESRLVSGLVRVTVDIAQSFSKPADGNNVASTFLLNVLECKLGQHPALAKVLAAVGEARRGDLSELQDLIQSAVRATRRIEKFHWWNKLLRRLATLIG